MGALIHASSASFIFFTFFAATDVALPAIVAMILSADAPNSRFQHHVSFDNFAGGEATEKNTISFTLNVSHKGYQRKRRSRTFMVGIDENDYSDIALQWMLEELVDDGDHIICLRVVDKDSKIASDKNVERREYQKAASDLMKRIQAKNDENRAISITLEFAVGKVHTTFQKMVCRVQLYGQKGGIELKLIVLSADSNVRTCHAHRRNPRSKPRRIPRPSQQPQLILKMVPPILPHTRCRRPTYREANEEENEARCGSNKTRLRSYFKRQWSRRARDSRRSEEQ